MCKRGMGDERGDAAGILKPGMALHSFAPHDTEAVMYALIGGCAGNAARGCRFTGSCELERELGRLGGEPELRQATMDLAAGSNALDDFLAEIAALGEVERAALTSLLREVAA